MGDLTAESGTLMTMRRIVELAGVAAFMLLLPQVAGTQSLADIARAEEARRKAVKQPSKVYTNADLKGGGLSVATNPTPPVQKEGAAKTEEAAKPSADVEKEDRQTDEATWRNRVGQLRAQLARDEIFAEALQTRVNSLTSDFVSRDDPAQREVISNDRQKAVSEMDRVRGEIEQIKAEIEKVAEEARRAGVPPGWLR